MMKTHGMRRRTVRAVTFALALILTLGALDILQAARVRKYKAVIDNVNQRAFLTLTSTIDSISTSLGKGVYATSPDRLSLLSATLWRESEAAKNSLAALPLDGEPPEKINRFLSQVGDYAMSMAEKVSRGGSLSEDELKNMLSLAEYSRLLRDRLAELERDVSVGGLGIGGLGGEASGEGAPTFSDGFNEMEKSFENYPKLIYDGPFSDNMLEREPLMTRDATEISEEKALDVARRICGTDELTAGNAELSSMPCYIFSDGDGVLAAAVSRQGGFPVYYLNSRAVGDETIGFGSAVRRAASYLKKLGYDSLRESYYESVGGVCTINFAHEQDGVVCYPDLIKVRVALDNGEIVGFDARGYLTNHRPRGLEAPALTAEEAASSLSPLLEPRESSLAVIPTGGGGEILAYELRCRGVGGDDVLVYVNAVTGLEEDVLLLIESDSGTLTR